MRRFIVEAVIDAILLLVIILFLGLITISQPFPFGTGSAPIVALKGAGPIGFLSWAAILVLVNRFARPVIVAFTGRFLFATMGLFVVIINALAIYLTAFLAPIKIADVAQPQVLWVVVAAGLYTGLSTLADAVLGLNRPTFRVEKRRNLWSFLESLPTPRRNLIIENLRLQQVYDALYTTSLDIALAGTPIGQVRRWFQRRVLGEADTLGDASGPERIRMMLQQLGPTYVKIGQMVASRSDVLPPVWIDELSKLQSEAAPFGYEDVGQHRHQGAWEAARGALRDVRSGPVRGRLHRPGPRGHPPRRDAGGGQGAATADRGQDQGGPRRHPGACRCGRETARHGAQGRCQGHGRRVRGRCPQGARLPQRGVPRPTPGRRDAALPGDPHPDDLRRAVGRARPDHGVRQGDQDLQGGRAPRGRLRHRPSSAPSFIRSIIKQVLIDGFFHGDPHPGNILADPISKQIIFLDMGLVGQLNSQQRVDLLGLIYAIKEVDIQGIGDGLMALGKPTRTFDEASFRDDIDRLARQYLIYGKARFARRGARARSWARSSTTGSSSTAS